MTRLIGLDVGSRRIGVALSDPNRLVASGRTVLTRSSLDADLSRMASLVGEEDVDEVVIGLPLSMDGSEGPQAAETRRFGLALASKLGLPVRYWDERLTTAEVERLMIGAGVKRQKRRESIDMAAATLLLQSYLDNANRAIRGSADGDAT